jgi:small subunit ribosomal protein S1
MNEHGNDRTDDAPEQSFEEMLAQSLVASPRLQPGDRVEAKVLKIGADCVFLDVGQKGEGVLDIKEVLGVDGAPTVAPGDTVHAYFLGREEDELQFTTRLGGGASGTAQLEQAWASGIPVEGRVERETKGGYEVRLAGGVRAFCPFSLSGLRRQESAEEAIGQSLDFKITKFEEQGRTIIVSHRAILEEQQRRQREALRRTLREGMVVRGTVTSIQRFGAFIDIGGLEGLLPASEAGWGRAGDLADLLRVGQEVEVCLMSCDWEKNRFTFSLRATLADPWSKVGTVYTRGSTHAGTVARLTPFGAFVTLEDGVDGLLHISKIGQGRRINHPREVLKEGQKLVVTIEEIDPARRRLSLALASQDAGEEDAAAYAERPPASMGTFGDLLKAGLEKKKSGR